MPANSSSVIAPAGTSGNRGPAWRWLRKLLPRPVRRWLRTAIRELPVRARDLPADLGDLLRRPPERLPPARLRRRVGLTSARDEFLAVGSQVTADVLAALGPLERDLRGRWLDFGCGCGRIVGPLRAAGVDDLWGVDVDRRAIRWLRRHRGGDRFSLSTATPPLVFPAASFDVVMAISIFTHLDEEGQLLWLGEMDRLLRPGGVLIASTHGSHLTVTRPDLVPTQVAQLALDGFLFAPGGRRFNDDSAFHTGDYLRRVWGSRFDCRALIPRGLGGYQDLSVWSPLSAGDSAAARTRRPPATRG